LAVSRRFPVCFAVSLSVALSLVSAAEESARDHNERGLFALRDKRFTEAATEFETARKLDPAFPDVDLNLGLALF